MKAIVYTDGSYREKDGVMVGQTGWVAVVIGDPPVVAKASSGLRSGIKSSHEAEWRAVFDAMLWVRRVSGLSAVEIVTDYQPMRDAINGVGGGKEHKNRADHLHSLFGDVPVVARWVPQRENVIAHNLSRKERT